jgi:hypothetical protein
MMGQKGIKKPYLYKLETMFFSRMRNFARSGHTGFGRRNGRKKSRKRNSDVSWSTRIYVGKGRIFFFFTLDFQAALVRVARFVSVQNDKMYQRTTKIPNYHKAYQRTTNYTTGPQSRYSKGSQSIQRITKYTKGPQIIPKDHKVYQKTLKYTKWH